MLTGKNKQNINGNTFEFFQDTGHMLPLHYACLYFLVTIRSSLLIAPNSVFSICELITRHRLPVQET